MTRFEKRLLIGCRFAIAAMAVTAWFSMENRGYAAKKLFRKTRQVAAVAEARGAGGESTEKTIEDAIEYARASHEKLEAVKDYTAVFTKHERVDSVVIDQSMEIKCRHEPFSVYLHFKAGKEEGREVIYVKGAHDDCLVVHEQGLLGSLAGTQNLKLDDSTVKAENRYPITEIGIARIIDKSLAIWQAEKKAGGKAKVQFTSNTKVNSVSCDIVEVEHSKAAKSEFSRSRVFFDHETKLPVRVERFSWPEKTGGKPELVEMYDYKDLKVNVGLTDADFDPKNPKYAFK